MMPPIRFAYTATAQRPNDPMPRLAMTLIYKGRAIEVVGLLDTGAMVSVIPYHIGLALGATWHEQTRPMPLGGSIGHLEARGIILLAAHPQLTPKAPVKAPVELGFAWTRSEEVPVIFGQANFFKTFRVCFNGAQGIFDIELIT